MKCLLSYFLTFLCFSTSVASDSYGSYGSFSPSRSRLYKKHHSELTQRTQRRTTPQNQQHRQIARAQAKNMLCRPTTCLSKCGLVSYTYNTDGHVKIHSHCPTSLIFRICCQWFYDGKKSFTNLSWALPSLQLKGVVNSLGVIKDDSMYNKAIKWNKTLPIMYLDKFII